MNEQMILESIPRIKEWIQFTLSLHRAHAQPVTSLSFSRIEKYFPSEFLASSKVVKLTPVPVPPLSKMGLTAFDAFERGAYAGITYGRTYFVHPNSWMDESLHFHELIHVVQWDHLGWDQFLKTYAVGLLQYGYLNSPLEVMARSHQSKFDSDAPPYDVQDAVRRELELVGKQL